MRLSSRKVFRCAQEDVSRAQVIAILVRYNRRAEERTPVWARWVCECVVWSVPRLQRCNQGVTCLWRRSCQRGKGTFFYSNFLLQHRNIPCTNDNGSEFLSRGGVVETIQTPERVTVDRSKQILEYLHDGFRVDGARYNHGLYHRVPQDQSAKAGKRHRPNLD